MRKKILSTIELSMLDEDINFVINKIIKVTTKINLSQESTVCLKFSLDCNFYRDTAVNTATCNHGFFTSYPNVLQAAVPDFTDLEKNQYHLKNPEDFAAGFGGTLKIRISN